MEFKVERLTIQGLRGIDELKLEFSQSEPTVLIGVNGVGKTTICDRQSWLRRSFARQWCYFN
jgi:predicted ATP-binding protein involved in virulence